MEANLRVFNLKNNDVFDDSFELETFIPEIKIDDNQGKEITLDCFVKDLKNENTWYTDSNGLEL